MSTTQPVVAANQTITLTDAKGKPAANVLVNAYTGSALDTGARQTNSSGQVSFSLAAGIHELRYVTSGKEVSLGYLTIDATGAITDFTARSENADGTTTGGSSVKIRAIGLGAAGSGSNGSAPSSGSAGAGSSPSKSGTGTTGGASSSASRGSSTVKPAFGTTITRPADPSCDTSLLKEEIKDEATRQKVRPFGTCLTEYLKNLYNWALVVGSGLAVMMIMYSGYTYVVAAGDPEAVRTAKDYLWGALLGLGLLILTYAIANTLRVGTSQTSAPPAASAGSAPPPAATEPSGGSQKSSTGDSKR